MELRRQAEAVSSKAEAAPKEKKPRKTTTKKAKEKPQVRKRLMWIVYSGSMKEEGRFSYGERAAAEERIEQLKLKSKKLYFIQPLKEIIGEDGVAVPVTPAASMDLDDEPAKPKKKSPKRDDDDDDEVDFGSDDDDDE
ncbi:MAG: hypothetical protein FJ267_19710 [Planctomycetes bacterium]|nr:hypothetical protein [Planctomycetota bacterium]